MERSKYGTPKRGENKYTLQHGAKIFSLSCSPDGKLLISSAMKDTSIKMWSVNSGTLLGTLEGHRDTVWSVAFSPDGRYILSGSADDTMKLWSREGKILHTFTGFEHDVHSVVFSHDGENLLAASGSDITIWKRVDRKLFSTLTDILQGIIRLKISSDSRLVAVAGKEKYIQIWDIVNKRKLISLERENRRGIFFDISFSQDNSHLVCAGGNITVWHLFAPKIYKKYQQLLQNLSLPKNFEKDGKYYKTWGEWYNFRRFWSLGSQYLVKAKQLGQEISYLALARSYWMTKEFAKARTFLQQAAENKEISSLYRDLCLKALENDK